MFTAALRNVPGESLHGSADRVASANPPRSRTLTAVDAYYAGSSSSLSIPDVRVPLLIIQVGMVW